MAVQLMKMLVCDRTASSWQDRSDFSPHDQSASTVDAPACPNELRVYKTLSTVLLEYR